MNNLNETRGTDGNEAGTLKTDVPATVKAASPAPTTNSVTGQLETNEAATVKAAADLLRTIKPSGLHPSCLEELAAALGRVKSLVSWLLCETTRVVGEAKTDLDAVDMLKKSVRLSGREAKQLSRVGKALPEMPNAARGLAEGEITLNHAASLASAAEECGAEIVDSDKDLLKQAADAEVDRFARLAREFASTHSRDRGESQLDRQRRQRRASVFTNEETGMGIVSGEFDPVSFNLMQQTIDNHTRALWQRDGGLDGKPNAVRSHKQRLCDAVFELITGRDAATHDPLPVDSGGAPHGRAKASAQLIILADIGVLDGTNPLGRCEVLGTGRVPTDILSSLSPDTELAGLIFDGKSRPLWLGRSQRLANAAQRLALAARDGGCVLCDEPMHRCQIHHIREWNTEGGKTDLDNLATLCGSHHRWLHNHGKTLKYIHESGWKVCDRKTGELTGARGTSTETRKARHTPTGTGTPQTQTGVKQARQTLAGTSALNSAGAADLLLPLAGGDRRGRRGREQNRRHKREQRQQKRSRHGKREQLRPRERLRPKERDNRPSAATNNL